MCRPWIRCEDRRIGHGQAAIEEARAVLTNPDATPANRAEAHKMVAEARDRMLKGHRVGRGSRALAAALGGILDAFENSVDGVMALADEEFNSLVDLGGEFVGLEAATRPEPEIEEPVEEESEGPHRDGVDTEPVTEGHDDERLRHQPDEDMDRLDSIGSVALPPDALDDPDLFMSGHDPAVRAEVRDAIERFKTNPDAPVKIYRAIPADGDDRFRHGDWVTLSPTYAQIHGDATSGQNGGAAYRVVEMEAVAGDLSFGGNDLVEWGWWGPDSE